MGTHVEILQQLNKACLEKDENTVRSLLSPNYTARCPLVSVGSRDEAIEMMKECSMKCHDENSVFVTEGNSVAHFYDWVLDAPFQAKIRTAQYATIENGQVRAIEMFYDTSAFPKEMLEQVEQMRRAKASV